MLKYLNYCQKLENFMVLILKVRDEFITNKRCLNIHNYKPASFTINYAFSSTNNSKS